MEDEVKLLYYWPSPFAMSCAIALKLKGVPFELIEQDLARPSKLMLESNPVYKQVPILLHNGRSISQSLVILEYIEETWPAVAHSRTSLFPASVYDKAVARFWADYGNKMFIETGLKLMKRFGEEHEKAREQAVQQYRTLEEGMAAIGSEGPFFFGKELTMPDIVLASFIVWKLPFEALGEIKFPDSSECPRMQAWMEAMGGVPTVKSCAPEQDKLSEHTKRMRVLFKGWSQNTRK